MSVLTLVLVVLTSTKHFPATYNPIYRYMIEGLKCGASDPQGHMYAGHLGLESGSAVTK